MRYGKERGQRGSLCCAATAREAGRLQPNSFRSGFRLQLLGGHPPADWLHPVAKFLGSMRADKHLLPERPIPSQPDLNLVSSRRQMEPLEGPVEVVDHTCVRPVHINLSFILIRLHLDPDGSITGAVRPISTSTCSRVGFRRRDRWGRRCRGRPRR